MQMSQWMEDLLIEPNNWYLFLFLMFLKIILDATRFRASAFSSII
jgi:hypothetical protein